MLRFASLGSGSKGNATLIESEQTRILVDCGFALRESEQRLMRLGCEPDSLTAIVITHEHGDHASGVGRLSRRYGIPVYASIGTRNALRDNAFASFKSINIHQPFSINALEFKPFPVPHDACEPCQFVVSDGQSQLGLLTDVGSITPCIKAHLSGVDALLLECNYDAKLLEQGAYPLSLKQRVAGSLGHLGNHQAQVLLRSIDCSALKHLIGMHLSEQNNRPVYAKLALAEGLGSKPDEMSVASQQEGFAWREL